MPLYLWPPTCLSDVLGDAAAAAAAAAAVVQGGVNLYRLLAYSSSIGPVERSSLSRRVSLSALLSASLDAAVK
jgi:hypothetical protein